MRLVVLLSLSISLIFGACRSDHALPQEDYRVVVRLDKDPERLNPMFAKNFASREVYQYMFLQMAEYNPETLLLEPILAKEIPSSRENESGEGQIFEMEILEDAVWPDGRSITAEDYLFTLKMVNHPLIQAPSWRNLLSSISEVKIDPDNPKKFEVNFSEDYALALEAASSFEIFPKHIYDQQGVLDDRTLASLQDESMTSEWSESDTSFIGFANRINSLEFNIEKMTGSGPYALSEWEAGQFVLLERKGNWWGNKYDDRPFLRAYPDEILFRIIPEETSALSQLKSGGIDIMSFGSAENFNDLTKNKEYENKLSFHTPQLTRFYYLGLNNQHVALQDKRVRKALAHCMDVDNIIETIEYGAAKRIVGAIPPSSNYYASELSPIGLDLDKARALLAEAGWKDSDGDQIVEKQIEGKNQNLNLRIFVSSSELGQKVALLMKENARKVGIDIEIVQKTFRNILRENIASGDYEIAALAIRHSLTPYDPYDTWHSDNAGDGKSNYSRYASAEADALIESIRESTDSKQTTDAYRSLQELMYEDQPVIFLYAPVSRIATSKKFEPLISVKRPGYFANNFKLVASEVFSNN